MAVATEFPPSTEVAALAANDPHWPRDGTANIASQLKSGYNHAVSAMWQAERQLHKVGASLLHLLDGAIR